nr:cytochrome c oxidase subunit II [Rhizobium sp. Q54]
MIASRLICAALLAGILPVLLSSCAGVQSALDPASPEAGRIGTLSWLLIGFCTVVLIGVCAIVGLALFGNQRWRSRISNERIIVGGGIIFPVISLSALLVYGFFLMGFGGQTVSPADDSLRIEVVGERWWWRVTYRDPSGRRIASANEIRLPVGRPVEVALTSADVIHSFWVPRLAGKLDMIPGRTNLMTLEMSEPGMSRGQCAEYCGGAHALMSFYVIGMPEEEFEAWLDHAADEGAIPAEEAGVQGYALFLASGCGGCHTVRGTEADGEIGPDLTHVGGRHSLAAGVLTNDRASFAAWLRNSQHIKPENLMPPYEIFSEDQLLQLASYLEQLE